jgi:DNA-binding transcriptional ArsR family regulator
VTDDAHPSPLPEPPAPEDIRLTDVLQALGDPNRLRMVQILGSGEWQSCGIETWGLNLHKATVSHHLKTLRQAGLFEFRLRGRNKDARLRRDVIESRFPGLLAGILSEEAAAEVGLTYRTNS